MKQALGDFARGLLYALPILLAAAFGTREILILRMENDQLEASMKAETRTRLAAEQKLVTTQRQLDHMLAEHLQASQQQAATKDATEERLNQVIGFLKKEVQSAETSILQLSEKNESSVLQTPSDQHLDLKQLLSEISRLNAEIEALRPSLSPTIDPEKTRPLQSDQ